MQQISTIRDQGRAARVLVVEDNEDHAELLGFAMEETRHRAELRFASDGAVALAMLRGGIAFSDAALPDLILLDINMPDMDGFEFLRQLGADAALKVLPVVVLTSSSNPSDLARMMELRCSSFVVKPSGFNELVAMLTRLGDYWFGVVALPRKQGTDRPP